MPRSRHIAPIAGMSWITPISLLTNITETRMVSGRSAALSVSRSSRPSSCDVEVGHLEALALELAHRVEHRLVLGLHRDEVLAARLVELRRALERQVVRLGGARGPDDLARVGADQRRPPARAPSRPPLPLPSPRHGCATPGCRSARAATGSSRRRRADPPASSRRSPCRSGNAGSCPWRSGARRSGVDGSLREGAAEGEHRVRRGDLDRLDHRLRSRSRA